MRVGHLRARLQRLPVDSDRLCLAVRVFEQHAQIEQHGAIGAAVSEPVAINGLGFAQMAEARGARTPSYQKVRKGLGIGVQTAWRNYRFLFQSDAAMPLYHWARFFSYPTE